MPKTPQPLLYMDRILENEYVQEQLVNAANSARAAYVRVRGQRAQAAQDKRLYRNLRQATTSLRNARTALQRPKPQPKRRGRKAVTIALAVGATALLTMQLQKRQSQQAQSSTSPSAVDSSMEAHRAGESGGD